MSVDYVIVPSSIPRWLEQLSARFPDVAGQDASLPYVAFDGFGTRVRAWIESDGLSLRVREALDFINEMARSPEGEVRNLVAVGVLEKLADSRAAREIDLPTLGGDARRLFEEVSGATP